MIIRIIKCLCWLMFLTSVLSFKLIAQKKTLTAEDCENWDMVGDWAISNNGQHVYYSYGSRHSITVLQGIQRKYKFEFKSSLKSQFSEDSNFFFYQLPGDTLIQIRLKDFEKKVFSNIKNYTLSKSLDQPWVILERSNKNEILVRNLITGSEDRYSATDYQLSERGDFLILGSNTSVVFVDLGTKRSVQISSTQAVFPVAISNEHNSIGFLSNSNNGYQLKIFQIGLDSAALVADNGNKSLDGKYEIARSDVQFSKDGKLLYFKVGRRLIEHPANNSSVTIWNYKDEFLQSHKRGELRKLDQDKKYTCVINIKEKSLFRLESDSIRLYEFDRNSEWIISYNVINRDENYWTGKPMFLYLINVKTGVVKTVKTGTFLSQLIPQLSPEEKYIIWLDLDRKQWYSYEIRSGIAKSITDSISSYIYEQVPGTIVPFSAWNDVFWTKGDRSIIIRDRFDIWEIDPLSKKPVNNLTNGFGRKNNISFYLLNNEEFSAGNSTSLLLSGVDNNNMNNGFWHQNTTVKRSPERLTMGPYVYYIPRLLNQKPLKAKYDKRYLVLRSSANQAPNLFVTKDFKELVQISNIQPQKGYNWLTSELVHWQLPNGVTSKGILYKPENFDPQKKYPVIFTYYEQRSDELNLYLQPELQMGRMNIPWFTNRGYVVFMPDMYYESGHNGDGIMATVTSAVNFLSSYSWVDKKRLGLQGHSFGGYETNYIITHTNIFAAAQEVAGQSDLISGYGGLSREGGQSRQSLYEKVQGNIPCPPWKCEELYIKNTPIFKINEITTPLLMVHNQGDNAVPYSQAIELFTGMRRAKKTVWMLEYANEGHLVMEKANRLDLTTRTLNFFDHYLKGYPMPEWMTTYTAF